MKNIHRFYGQHGEDQYLYEMFFKDKRNGFFVELGALDGVTFSNTLFFQQNLDWGGILIEPCKSSYDKLVSNRAQQGNSIIIMF